jgi:hypothetical protein
MNTLRKMGGVAALYEAAAYLVAIMYFMLIVSYADIVEPIQKVAVVVGNQAGMFVTTFLAYIVFGIFLVVLTLALHERLSSAAPAVMQVATAIGLIWAALVIASGMVFNMGLGIAAGLYGQDPAQAGSAWLAIEAVANGLGGANGEILGGAWMLLVSLAALRGSGLSRALNYLGVAIGVAGILSVLPGLALLAGVFGLSQVVWFVWLGLNLLRVSPGVTV